MESNFKNRRIDIKALCLIEYKGKLLLNIGYDKTKKEKFFRIIGGSVRFGEKAREAIKREIKEELSCKIINLRFLKVVENIFNYEGKKRHEISFIFKGDLSDKGIYNKRGIHYIKNKEKFDAKWVPISNILEKKVRIYPTFNYQKLFSSILK